MQKTLPKMRELLSQAGSGRLLLRSCLVTLVGATHYAENITQDERVNVVSRNVFHSNTNILSTRHNDDIIK